MTTYTLTGLAVYRNPANDQTVGVDNTDVTLELVVPDTTTSFRYTVNPLNPGELPGEGNETVDTALDDYTVRIDGMTVVSGSPTDPEISIFKVNWADASGSHTSTVLVPVLAGISVSALGLVDADYFFVIAGTPLPSLTTPGAWDAFEGSVTAITVPTGTYGPGTNIALTNLRATVSENDLITGTGGGDVFRGGAGNDQIDGLGGNDKLYGGNGNDRLDGDGGNDRMFGGGGRDKLFGAKGNDTLNGGKGNDKMTGNGGNDTFVFSKGNDVVTDFDALNNKEKIDLSGVSAITGINNLRNNFLNDVAGDAVIDDGNGNTLTLTGVDIADLGKGDFIF